MSGITNPAEKYFKDGLWTFDGTVWRPQGQLIAYRDVVREYKNAGPATAGTNVVDFTAVPAGEVHVIEHMLAWNATTAASSIQITVYSGVTEYALEYTAFLATTRYIAVHSTVVIKAGEKIRMNFYGCLLNDNIYGRIVGYKFKIAE